MLHSKLKYTRNELKIKKWDTDSLHNKLSKIKNDQHIVLSRLEEIPGDPKLILVAKKKKKKINTLTLPCRNICGSSKGQKAHWLQNSDDDLKYLYTSVKVKNNSNLIRMIHTPSGPITNQTGIVAKFCSHFSNLFSRTNPCTIAHDIPDVPSISCLQSVDLGTTVTDNEIINSLKSIDENKFPRVDGFNSRFFTKCWDVVGPLFLRAAHHFFTHYKMPDTFEHNLITLIPKVKNF